MVEVWLPINECPRYLISSEGRVKNGRTGRILKDGPNSGGYSCVKLFSNGEGLQRRVHRLVMNAFCPTEDLDLDINHIDRDKSNNAVWNLEWVTHGTNMKHASNTGFRTRTTPSEKIRIVELGQDFPTISACARAIGGERRGVQRCLTGQSITYLGYHFKYVGRFD